MNVNDPLAAPDESKLRQYIQLKLAALGRPTANSIGNGLLAAADRRVQTFLEDYFTEGSMETVPLPTQTFVLDRPGLARILSLPADGDFFASDIVNTYRVAQGVLHNPKNDRRTTAGVFHIAEGGLPIPHDKKAVPRAVFRNILTEAFRPPEDLQILPFTAESGTQAKLLVSLLMRPTVVPAVPPQRGPRSLEVRFFVPGSLVGNLDFVESIFGNAGDPYLVENDAALDPAWTGHTGCVILAPQLTAFTKKRLGLPPFAQATDRQKRDGMCWKSESELYNDGQAFKVTCRDERGVMVTVIADNYFGYCKKEVKTQISFAANLLGGAEEEHSGGAIAFPSYGLGEVFRQEDRLIPQNGATFKDLRERYAGFIDFKPEGYGVDRKFADVFYVPEDSLFDMHRGVVEWKGGKTKLLARAVFFLPNGYKVSLEKQPGGRGWQLTGTNAEGTLCHKPSTVSGGGKSEISKSIEDAMVQGPVFVADLSRDLDEVEKVLSRDFGGRFKNPKVMTRPSRPILSTDRSLGSVIKLLTPAEEYTPEFNAWLTSIPPHVLELVFVVKRFYLPEWGGQWREHFGVDMANGALGHELKVDGRRITAQYLRVGYEADGARRILRVRQDFNAARKVQVEDDITCSTVVPRTEVPGLPETFTGKSVKLVQNCEFRLFQRPDDAIYRGYDRQAESDLAGPNVFLSNWEPLGREAARGLAEDAMGFEQFTPPIQNLFQRFLGEERPAYIVSSSQPRLVDGKPTKNPRYLQNRPDLIDRRGTYVAEVGKRLFRKLTADMPVVSPVTAVLAGRRNNPPDPESGAPPLAVYNPIHYQELPELFMDLISSLTGKSPSTTGFGSEGALTKGPFNALWPVHDLNNALVSFVLTELAGFSTAAGHVGPKYRVDHDISLLVPEIWSRLTPAERHPAALIQNGHLEKVQDFDYQGRRILASRLGYRITQKFVRGFLGRIFNNPKVVFGEAMLKPETQDMGVFVEGVEAIVEAQKRVALDYFADGSVEAALPPLKALLHIMAYGQWEGKDVSHPEVRALFSRENLLQSEVYRRRLAAQQDRDIAHWRRHGLAIENALKDEGRAESLGRNFLQERLDAARQELSRAQSTDYQSSLEGALGVDPSLFAPAAVPS